MANLYGPMQYKPNPGMTLNSAPQFQMPAAPAAAPVATQPNYGPSINEWAKGQGYKPYFRGGGRDSTADLPMAGWGQRQVNPYARYEDEYASMLQAGGMVAPGSRKRNAMMGQNGGAIPGASAPGILSLDPVAAAYANFLNGRA